MNPNQARAELFVCLPIETLTQERAAALARRDTAAAQEFQAAIHQRSQSQTPDIANSGRLFEHVEQPSPTNGGRFITRFTGDILATFGPFMQDGRGCRLNHNIGRGDDSPIARYQAAQVAAVLDAARQRGEL
jgi:hypothetical protein